MIVKTFSQLNDGDYVRFHAHRVNPSYSQVWRKVRRIGNEAIELTDRHGGVRTFSYDAIRQGGIRFKCWTPGDPREDGDNL